MYYFVLEQPKNRWQAAFQNKIVAFLEDLQIVGEVAKANPIQKPEELCQLGLKKGYHTIVAIGSDTMISTLAAIVARHGATLGIVPQDSKSSFFGLINCLNWEEACSALPKRRVEIFDMGKAAEDRFFLTFIKVISSKKNKISQVIVKFQDFEIDVPAIEIIITNGAMEKADSKFVRKTFSDSLLDIYISTKATETKESFFSTLFKKEKPFFSSLFHANKIKIFSREQILEVVSPDQKIITKTPAEIEIVPQAIKIIVKKSSRS